MPLEQINFDSNGLLPVSRSDSTFVIVLMCDVSALSWAIPVRTKGAVVFVVRDMIREIRASEGVHLQDKVAYSIRSDNEAVFRSSSWRQMLLEEGVKETHSAPYSPQMNGVVERYMQTLGSNLRANLRGVDFSVWDYCVKYIAWCWSRSPSVKYGRRPKFTGLAPKRYYFDSETPCLKL